jgi:hypothetical protein
MNRLGSLIIALNLVSACTAADETSKPMPRMSAAPQAQPSEPQMQRLQPSERAQLSVDLSPNKGKELEQHYEQLMRQQGNDTDPPLW